MKLVRPSCYPEEYKIIRQVIKAIRSGIGIQFVSGKGEPIGEPYYVTPEVNLDFVA